MDRRFRVATGPMNWFLRRYGFAAMTLPWRQVHIIFEYRDDPSVIAHEQVHLDQIDRDGPVWFTLRYLYWLARYGYRANPYEVEAYRKAP